MKRHRLGRRLMFLLLVATGPLSIGCEAILDFDRTPLQPVTEAGAEASASATDAAKKDSSQPNTTGDKDAAPDAPDQPMDAGPDADADAHQ